MNFFEKTQYFFIFNKLPKKTREFYIHVYKKHKRKLTYVQLGAIKLLLKNKDINIGDAILQPVWSKKDKKRIIHVVAMSYDFKKFKERKMIKGTSTSIKKAVRTAMNLAVSINSKQIAIPIMCPRKKTGFSPEKSLSAILSVLKEFKDSSIEKVIICFDNKDTEKYLDQVNT